MADIVAGDASDLPSDKQEETHKLVFDAAKMQMQKLREIRWSARVSMLSSAMAKYKATNLTLNDISVDSSACDLRAMLCHMINYYNPQASFFHL